MVGIELMSLRVQSPRTEIVMLRQGVQDLSLGMIEVGIQHSKSVVDK